MRRTPDLRAHSRLRKKLRSRLAGLSSGLETSTPNKPHCFINNSYTNTVAFVKHNRHYNPPPTEYENISSTYIQNIQFNYLLIIQTKIHVNYSPNKDNSTSYAYNIISNHFQQSILLQSRVSLHSS